MRALSLSLFAALSLSLLGCSAQIPEGQLRCDATHGCPTDWSCHADGRCYSHAETTDGGGVDVGPRDGGPDAGAMDVGGGDVGLDGGVDANVDVGMLPDVGADTGVCATAADCDDGTFCNGPERCAPGDPMANLRGCAPFDGTFSCGTGRTCDETMDACLSPCATDPDQDDDGHQAVECGGDDCDDGNAARYPGRVESCDDIDNDCDPTTIGTTDADGDGAVSSSCCNTDAGGVVTCGADCNDGVMGTHPGATEACNAMDDDCDARIDETATHTYYRDGDDDGHGAMAMSMTGCTAPMGYVTVGDDCDDANNRRFPTNPEVCDAIDNDCVGGVDNGISCMCTNGTTQACGTDVGVCVAGMQSCSSGRWGTCTGSVGGTTETCNGMDDDCNGMVDNGATCPPHANTTSTCSGSCTYACAPNFGSCNGGTGSDTDGCETDLRTTTLHCGNCATACTTPSHGATQNCVASACHVLTCAPGYGDCNGTYSDGCELPLTSDPNNCGGCRNVCPTRSFSTPTCTSSTCHIACMSGHSNCDGNEANGCETPSASCTLLPPRLIGPLVDTVVTTRRPILRFALASGTDAAHVQICSDAACTAVVATIDGTSPMTVNVDLARGRYYWRAFGRAGTTNGATPSATWRFVSFATTTPARASTGFTYLNVRGGLEDVAIGTPSTTGGTISYYEDASATVTQTLTAPSGAMGFGAAVAAAGDVNGDGFGDLLVGACLAEGMDFLPTHCGGQVYVYTGTAAGTFNTTPFATATRPTGYATQGYSVSSAGDFNGDGYGDFVAGDYYGNRAALYLGNTSWLAIRRVDLLPDGTDPGDGNAGGLYGISVAGVGDVNGDGYSDVAVGRALGTSGQRVYLYLGNAAGTSSAEIELSHAALASPNNVGLSVTGLGDVNGDGLADIGASGNAAPGHALVFLGQSSWSTSTSVTTAWLVYTGASANFGVSMIGPGDVNGDGFCDFAVSRSSSSTMNRDVTMLLGGAAPPTMAFWTLAGTMDGYGRFLGRGGLGSDLLADLLIGECSGNDDAVLCNPTVQLALGRAAMSAPTTTSWTGTGYFGQGVCR